MYANYRSKNQDCEAVQVVLNAGPLVSTSLPSKQFVPTQNSDTLLEHMVEDHFIGRDMCIIGPKGSGKSTLVRSVSISLISINQSINHNSLFLISLLGLLRRQFASLLGYETEHMMLYKDMSTRDLLQRRSTNKSPTTDRRLAYNETLKENETLSFSPVKTATNSMWEVGLHAPLHTPNSLLGLLCFLTKKQKNKKTRPAR